MDWMLVTGNIFSVETRILDCLFCKCQVVVPGQVQSFPY